MKHFSLQSSVFGSPTRSCIGVMKQRKDHRICWLRASGSAVSISVERLTFWVALALATGVWAMFGAAL